MPGRSSRCLSAPEVNSVLRRRFERLRRGLVTALAPALLLLSFEHAQGVAGIKTKLMLQDPRRSFPNSGFMPSDEKCTSDMLDFLVRLIHLCPHTEAPRLRQVNRKQFRYQLLARCLICGVVSVPEKTRLRHKSPVVGLAGADRTDPLPDALLRLPSRSQGTGRCPASDAGAVDPGSAWRSRHAAPQPLRRLSIRSRPRCSGRRHGYDRWSD